MRTIFIGLIFSIVVYSCHENNSTDLSSKSIECNLVIKYQVIYLNDTPCCRDIVLSKLNMDGIAQFKWENQSTIIELKLDTNILSADSILLHLNSIEPLQIKFSELYQSSTDINSMGDTNIIITTPKTEEELDKEKEQISV